MKNLQKYSAGILGVIGMLILLLDPKTAMLSAQDGIKLCIVSVIPSLFPFFVFSGVINGSLDEKPIRLLRPIQRLCRIPEGSEVFVLLGLLGGYPIGAHNINEACKTGNISKQDAQRLLGFCNNPGPSFIFGILGGLFRSPSVCWAIWSIIITSSLLTGTLLPGKAENPVKMSTSVEVTFAAAMHNAIRAMASVCGWVILFKVINAYLVALLPAIPDPLGTLLFGTLELTNGCHGLYGIQTPGARFILGVLMLAFGGVCVFMQTAAATKFTGLGSYFPGKLLQSSIAFLLAYALQPFLFSQDEMFHLPVYTVIAAIFIPFSYVFVHKRKKSIAIPRNVMYNIKNH